MIFKWIKYYSWRFILDDALAGLSLSTIIIPQSLAYSKLAQLPPVYGLYVSIIPPLVYTVLGNHPYTSIGTFAIVSIVISESLSSVSIPSSEYVGFAAFLAFLVGIIELLASVFGLVTMISKHLFKNCFISGFTVASVITIITSQLKSFFGLPFATQNGLFSIPVTWYLVITNIKSTNIATLALSMATVVLIRGAEFLETVVRKWLRNRKLNAQLQARQEEQVRDETNQGEHGDDQDVVIHEKRAEEKIINVFPSILFAVILLTFVSKTLDLPGIYGVAIIGNIPSGLPSFSLPWKVLFNINKDTLFLVGQLIYRVLSLAIICSVTSASIMDLYPGHNPGQQKTHLSLVDLSQEQKPIEKEETSLNQEVFALSVAGIIGIYTFKFLQ